MNFATRILEDPRYNLHMPKTFPPDLEPLVDIGAMNFVWNSITHVVPCKDGSYIDIDDSFLPCHEAENDEQINNERGHSIYWYVTGDPANSFWCPEAYWTTIVSLAEPNDKISMAIQGFFTQATLDLIYENPIDGFIYNTLDEALDEILHGPDKELWLTLKTQIEKDPNFKEKVCTSSYIVYPNVQEES